jgi:hypothetical protein
MTSTPTPNQVGPGRGFTVDSLVTDAMYDQFKRNASDCMY